MSGMSSYSGPYHGQGTREIQQGSTLIVIPVRRVAGACSWCAKHHLAPRSSAGEVRGFEVEASNFAVSRWRTLGFGRSGLRTFGTQGVGLEGLGLRTLNLRVERSLRMPRQAS